MATPKTKPKRARQSVESTFADKWEPQNEGDEISGRYIWTELAPGKRKGETFRVFHLRDDDGKRWSLSGAHLESFMNQIRIGTYVFVTYEGEREVGNGNMKVYKVDVEEGAELKGPPEDDDEDEDED